MYLIFTSRLTIIIFFIMMLFLYSKNYPLILLNYLSILLLYLTIMYAFLYWYSGKFVVNWHFFCYSGRFIPLKIVMNDKLDSFFFFICLYNRFGDIGDHLLQVIQHSIIKWFQNMHFKSLCFEIRAQISKRFASGKNNGNCVL